jgi:GNAT superfamily N-acetyltransferase
MRGNAPKRCVSVELVATSATMTTTTSDLAAGDPRVDEFHRGIYLDEFAEQAEPVATWHAALAGDKPYTMTLRLALDGDRILGGICIEHYPRSNCGLLTYIVVAPQTRGQGIGKQLQTAAIDELYARGVRYVFGELNDPRVTKLEPTHEAWDRVQRIQRWGARVVDTRYVQPSLGEGRDRQLLLIVFGQTGSIDGRVLRAFLDEFYEVTEGGPPDPEITIPDVVRLVTL